jgi:hypothetical protein
MRNNKKRSKTIMELAEKNLQRMGQWEIAQVPNVLREMRNFFRNPK